MEFDREEALREEEDMAPINFDDSMLGRINEMKSMVRKDQEEVNVGVEEQFKDN